MKNVLYFGKFSKVGIFDFFKKKDKQTIQKKNESDIQIDKKNDENRIEDIVQELAELGYFKYAAENDLENLKKEVYNSLIEDGYLSTLWDDEYLFSKDYRHYSLDGETLYEQDGFIEYLQDFEYLFDKIDSKMIVTNHFEEYDSENETLNHSITINGKDYIIFSNFKGYGWGEAAQRFAEILNDQFEIHGIEERIYLANGGNDGRAIILTKKQYNLLDPILKHPTDRPQKIEKWCRIMEVKRIQY